MTWTDLKLRIRALRFLRRAESDLDDELQFHLEMEALKMRNSGQDEKQARLAARAHFGGVDLAREECRDARGLTMLENLARDVRYGLRQLRKTPAFTAVAILSLAIGIGANTAVFTLVDTVLLRMLPVKNPEQLVVLKWGAKKGLRISTTMSSGGTDEHGRSVTNVFNWRDFESLRAQGRTADFFGFSFLPQLSVAANGQTLVTGGTVVSGNYFSVLGAPVLIGRPITDDDETAGGATAVVISYGLWERVFGRDPGALGRTMIVNAQACTIVGVTAKDFYGVSLGGFNRTPQVDVTIPIRARARFDRGMAHFNDFFSSNNLYWVQLMGRRRPGSSDGAIAAEVAATATANLPEAARREFAAETPYASVEPGRQGLAMLREAYGKPLLTVMAVAALTLLMACSNLAGLLLARASARSRELMVRLALGARRTRLVRQLLVEGALLSGAGALAGLALAYAGVKGLLGLLATGMSPVTVSVSPDARALAFTTAVSLVTTLLFALAPALRATRVDVASGLKQDTPGAASQRFGAVRVLVAAQIAVAVLLATGATLLTRTLVNLRSVPLGFNAGSLVIFDIAPGRNGYDDVRGKQLYDRVLDRLRQTPGVTGASLSAERLVSGWMSGGDVSVDGRRASSHYNFVGADFLSVMQIPVVAGRGVEQRDMSPNLHVAVANETFVRRYLNGQPPVGKRIQWEKQDVEIIGVARDARYTGVRGEIPPTLYAPYTQRSFGFPDQVTVEVRTAGDRAAAVAAVRGALRELAPALPLIDLKTQQAQADDMLAQERLFAWLVSLFGSITIVLACVGLYGLIAASVATRTREIGVRMALGASRGAVLRMIVGQVGGIAAVGVAIGIAASLSLTRVIEARLFGVKAHDPATLAVAAFMVVLLAVAAALLPARRAMRIDPVRALRYE